MMIKALAAKCAVALAVAASPAQSETISAQKGICGNLAPDCYTIHIDGKIEDGNARVFERIVKQTTSAKPLSS